MKTIGILGGMGPEATADLYISVIRIFQKECGAKYDSDFPPFFMYSLPIPDVVEGTENEKATIALLKMGVKKLESIGVDFIAIACNTVQCYLDELRAAVSIPILSIPLETMREIKKKEYKNVGLLATKTTVNKKLFDREATKIGITICNPDKEQQKTVTTMIMDTLAGKNKKENKEKLKKITAELEERGAEAIILGCTDLPIILKQEDVDIELFNTTDILARAIVRECQQNIFKEKEDRR